MNDSIIFILETSEEEFQEQLQEKVKKGYELKGNAFSATDGSAAAFCQVLTKKSSKLSVKVIEDTHSEHFADKVESAYKKGYRLHGPSTVIDDVDSVIHFQTMIKYLD